MDPSKRSGGWNEDVHAASQIFLRSIPPETLQLLDEIDGELNSDRWAILTVGSDVNEHKHLTAATLRHAAWLLLEAEASASVGLEMSARMLYRSHLETCLLLSYLHLVGPDSLNRVKQHFRFQVERIKSGIIRTNETIEREVEWATQRNEQATKQNIGIEGHNKSHPENPVPLRQFVPVPQSQPQDVSDLDRAVAFLGVQPKELDMNSLLATCTKLAREKGLMTERFDQIYNLYRFQSTLGPHPNYRVVSAYFDSDPNVTFARTLRFPDEPSPKPISRAFSIYFMSWIAEQILATAPGGTPVSAQLKEKYASGPSGEES